jgi:hypothetical protein
MSYDQMTEEEIEEERIQRQIDEHEEWERKQEQKEAELERLGLKPIIIEKPKIEPAVKIEPDDCLDWF